MACCDAGNRVSQLITSRVSTESTRAFCRTLGLKPKMRSWSLTSSGDSVFTASSPLAYFRHIFSLFHAASVHSPVHATIPTVPARPEPKGDHGQVGLNSPENMKLPSIAIVPGLGKTKSLKQVEDSLESGIIYMWKCGVAEYPQNSDHLNKQMMMNPVTPWSFPKPSSLEAATCLCPDCWILGEKLSVSDPQKSGRN